MSMTEDNAFIRLERRGVSRDVLLIGNYALKIPSLKHGTHYFVMGMFGNSTEARIWSQTKDNALAYIYWSAPFGLLNICKRYHITLSRVLTKDELDSIPLLELDNNGHNFAISDGRLVVLDYGNPGILWIGRDE